MCINGLNLDFSGVESIPSICWFDLVPDDATPLSIASNKVVNRWLEQGLDIKASAVSGEPFWGLQEITIAPGLLDATTAVFSEAPLCNG